MALIQINLKPSGRDLRWFGAIVLLFFGLIGALVLWRSGSMTAAVVLWSIGAALSAVYYGLRPFQRPMYLGWMFLLFPIGWTISHLILAIVYYLVLTPIGLIMRLFGRDPMERRFRPEAPTYWVEHRPAGELGRYFRQF
jgi:hypothetical protein